MSTPNPFEPKPYGMGAASTAAPQPGPTDRDPDRLRGQVVAFSLIFAKLLTKMGWDKAELDAELEGLLRHANIMRLSGGNVPRAKEATKAELRRTFETAKLLLDGFGPVDPAREPPRNLAGNVMEA